MKEAQKFAAKGQFDKAVLEWRKLLKDFPSDSSIYNTIGDLSLKKGDAKGKADAVDAYYRAGTILAAEGFSSKAIAVFKKVLNIDPQKMEVHLALGDMNAEKGLTSNALESYKLAADHYKKSKDMRKAISIYQKMADLNPSNAAFRLKLADMYAKEGMNEAAIKSYLEAADVHMANGVFNDARQIFEKALILDPNNKQVYHKAGIVYFKEGKFPEACKALKPVFEDDPENKGLAELYLDALVKAGRDVEAVELCKKLLSQDAGRADLHEKLFHLYLVRKEHDKALVEAAFIAEERLKKKADAGDGGRKMLPGSGEAEPDAEAEAALENLKGLVAENPDFAEARRTLGDFYAKVGRGSDAAKEFVQTAEILIGNGDREGAKAALARAIELAPDSTEAKQRLDSLQAPPASEPKPPAAEPAVEPPAPPVETPPPAPAPFVAPPVAPAATPAATAALGEDPAIAGAITEAEVLVKYGLSSKALEQLEGLAKKFPESAQVRIKLRDLYGDQGNMGKAVAHMLVLADIYAGRSMQAEADAVLHAALELEPGNAEIQSRLGGTPAAPTEAPPAPGELTGESMFAEPGGEAAPLEQALPPSEEPPLDISAGLDMTPPEPAEEFGLPAAPSGEEPALGEPEKEASEPGEISFDEPFTVPELPEEETREEQIAPEATAERLGGPEPELAMPEPEEVFEKPAAPVQKPVTPAAPRPEEKVDLAEIWAEAEFYYQQGLFDEAKKHYAKIIQHDPNDTRAIDRLTEISREAVETQEFSKLAEAVDELEGYAGGGDAGKELAASESDEEAVRSLMQEIAQLKQKEQEQERGKEKEKEKEKAPSSGSSAEDVAAPPPRQATPAERALTASDEEAVRSLMQEIAQLKQKEQPAASSVEDAATPPRQTPAKRSSRAPKEETVAPASSDLSSAGAKTRPAGSRSEEDFFDLGEELRDIPAPPSPPAAPGPTPKQADDFFDLASELRDELSSISVPPPSSATAEEQSLDDIFEEFKKGVTQQAAKEDVDTHYNLGVAYKEMGLLDDAIAEFVLTPETEPKFIQSRTMLGLCYMEKGEYQNAIGEIRNALNYSESFGGDMRERIGIRYDLGLAYQGAGDANNALNEFQKVHDVDPGYRDTATKLKELQKGDFISMKQLQDDIEREISSKFLEEGERIEREEKIRKNEKVRG